MMRSFARVARCCLWATVITLAAAPPGAAQSAPPSTSDAQAPAAGPRYDEVVITAAPVPRSLSDLAPPASVLKGENLLLQQAPQLGEVLATQPGISQSYFGPGASRPVIRGLGGDNIRVLENGLGTFDASAVSPDHAVSMEPLLFKSVEVVRGPAALLYGPTAIGGVVNSLTNRIPDERIVEPIRGTIEGRGNTVDDGGAGVALIEGGHGPWAYHLDGFARKSEDLTIPGFACSAQVRGTPQCPNSDAKGTLPNSAIETQGGSGGLSYVGDRGYFGLAPSVYNTTYGTVAEPDVTIDLHQRRLDFAGALNTPLPRMTSIKARLGLVDYEHVEFEGDEPGTTFKNRGYDLRIDGLHEPIGPVEGAVGFESIRSDFSALGDEAFMPPTVTTTQAVFAFEEVVRDPIRFQMAGRIDYQAVDADADPMFGPADSRTFVTGGVSTGVIWTPVDPYALAVTVSYSQRPPNAQELYADGPHLATGQFEIGDRNLSAQQALGVDVAVRRRSGPVTGSIGGYYNRFVDYLDLSPTGQTMTVSGNVLPVFVFSNVPATFVGMEAETTITLVDQQPHTFEMNLKADYVNAENRDTNQPLPYIPPFRFGVGFTYRWRTLSATLSTFQASKQNRVPAGTVDLPTDAYTLLNFNASYEFQAGPTRMNLFLRAFNLLDQQAREATSVLKDIAPLPGRGVLGGFRVSF